MRDLRSTWRHFVALGLLCIAHQSDAATCVWNAPSGNWSAVANWTGCADSPGPSTRTPGVGDIAVVANGTANLDASPSVAEFELGPNGLLSVVGGTKMFDIGTAMRLAGGKATTILGTNQLHFHLAVGATGTLIAPTTFENAVFFENNGTMTLGSGSGVALTLLVASELRNMPGGSIAIGGGDSRLYLGGSSSITNHAGATVAIVGNTQIVRPPAVSANTNRLINEGTITMTGPGTLDLSFGSTSSVFNQYGDLVVSNATLICSPLAAEKCQFTHSNGGDVNGSTTWLDNGVLMLGGNGANFSIPTGSTLGGTGTINAHALVNGALVPGSPNGPPYGTLAINGDVSIGYVALLDVDVGGVAVGNYDRVQVTGVVTAGDVGNTAGRGILNVRVAPGFTPALGASVPVMSYTSVVAGSAFTRVDTNYVLDYAATYTPTLLQVFPAPRITVADASVVEGNSGTASLVLNVQLSQPTSQTVSAQLQLDSGTASYGLPPSGDFLYPGSTTITFTPGQVLVPVTIQVHGDAVVEGDEAFAFALRRNTIVNAAAGSHVPGNVKGVGVIVTDDLPPGTRFVLVGKDNGLSGPKVRRYTSTGTYVDTWGPDTGNFFGYIATGLCFSPNGNVLTTRFGYPNPILYSRTGAVLDADFASPPGVFGFNYHESCVFDRAGNVYVGQAGGSGSSDATVPIRKFDRYGTPLEDFVVPTGTRGTDWIDLAGDQCTMYYTSEDTSVRRYNLCTRTALPVFATGLTPPYCYALRLRPNHELMVACQEAVHRLNPQGVNIQTYTRQSIGETNAQGLFALNLDPDGTSFWTAGALSGNVYRVDIASGAVLGSFNSGPGGVAGLGVYDELGDDVIFANGFEAGPIALPIVPTGPSDALYDEEEEAREACGTAFWPEAADMPHYVPHWMSVVPREPEGGCED